MINSGDTAWVLASAALVLFMTPGLAIFYGGMVRAKSALNMTDEAGGDDKLLCVAAGDVRKSYLQDLNDVPAYELSEIKHFFEVYKTLEPGKSVQGGEWVGHDEAELEINASYARFKDSH